MTGATPGRLERLQLGLVVSIACLCLLSIFAAEVCLALAVVVYLVRLAKGRTELLSTPLDGPILAFAVWTLLSASFSANPNLSHGNAKKLVLFAVLYLAVDSLRREEARSRAVDAALLGGLVLGMGSLAQRYLLGYDTVTQRPHSFLGHYMTASGLLMVAILLSAARLLFRREPLRWPGRRPAVWLGSLAALFAVFVVLQGVPGLAVTAERLFVAVLAFGTLAWGMAAREESDEPVSGALAALTLPISVWAMLISQTRSAWIGTIAGLVALAVLKTPRVLLVLAAGVAAILVLRPAPVMSRLTVQDASSLDRIYMWQAGVDMIRDKPIFGQGPNMILRTYPQYRWPEAPNPLTPHMHNNALQIAAERGLPGLVWWLWWVAVAMGAAYRVARARDATAVWGVSALCVLVAIMAAGLFEYNFGDSEILMIVLLVSALPFTLRPAS